MTQPSETTVQDRPEPTFGVGEGVADDLLSLPTDYSALPASAFDDRQFTLVGYDEKPGGEERLDEATGRVYTTNDQLLITWRAIEEDVADVLADSNGTLIQYLTLPKAIIGSNGVRRRPSPTRSTSLGLFLGALDALGISSNPQRAHKFKMNSWTDLIGMQFVRRRVTYQLQGTRGRTLEIDVPVAVVGVDNDYRKEKGLPPIKIEVDAELNV